MRANVKEVLANNRGEMKLIKYCTMCCCGCQTKLVGLMDADVYGPSIPQMINLKGPVHLNKRKVLLFCKV